MPGFGAAGVRAEAIAGLVARGAAGILGSGLRCGLGARQRASGPRGHVLSNRCNDAPDALGDIEIGFVRATPFGTSRPSSGRSLKPAVEIDFHSYDPKVVERSGFG